MLQGTVEEAEVRWVSNYYTVAPPLGHPDQVKRAAELLVRAERPMLIIGKGYAGRSRPWSSGSSSRPCTCPS